jgi:hypothetical protein
LDHEYQSNQKIVSSNLKHPPNPDVPPDLAAALIIRLIQRGDTDLLPDLFKATSWADGAMGDELSSFFIEEMKGRPTQFLTKLSEQPREIRPGVYRLIFNETTITDEDIKTIKALLKTPQRQFDIIQDSTGNAWRLEQVREQRRYLASKGCVMLRGL